LFSLKNKEYLFSQSILTLCGLLQIRSQTGSLTKMAEHGQYGTAHGENFPQRTFNNKHENNF
jgi:hypothetical protein